MKRRLVTIALVAVLTVSMVAAMPAAVFDGADHFGIAQAQDIAYNESWESGDLSGYSEIGDESDPDVTSEVVSSESTEGSNSLHQSVTLSSGQLSASVQNDSTYDVNLSEGFELIFDNRLQTNDVDTSFNSAEIRINDSAGNDLRIRFLNGGQTGSSTRGWGIFGSTVDNVNEGLARDEYDYDWTHIRVVSEAGDDEIFLHKNGSELLDTNITGSFSGEVTVQYTTTVDESAGTSTVESWYDNITLTSGDLEQSTGQVFDAPDSDPDLLTSPNGHPVPNATVIIKDGTTTVDTVTTNVDGEFTSNQLTEGETYSFEIYAGGGTSLDDLRNSETQTWNGNTLTFGAVMRDPTIDDIHPPGEPAQVTAQGVELNATFTDEDFPQDEVEMTFYEFSTGDPDQDPVIHEENITTTESDNQTHTITADWADGGDQGVHQWYAVAGDQYLYTDVAASDVQTYSVHGGVVRDNLTDAPIQGATVAFRQDGQTVASTTTNATGEWRLVTDPGDYVVRYTHPSYFGVEGDVSFAEGEFLDLTAEMYPQGASLSNASPRGGEYIANRSDVQLGIDVEDAGSGTVDVEFFWANASGQWESVGTDQVSGEGRATTTIPQGLNGENQWFAQANASNDIVSNSSVYTYEHPGDIEVRDAEDTSTVLDSVTITAEISSLDSSYEDTQTSNGVIDLEEVPDETLRLRLNASGYENRTFVIDDVTQDYLVTMLNSSTFDAENNWYIQRFTLIDNTGEWSPNEVDLLLRQRVDGNFTTVASDRFGLENLVGFIVNSEDEYRLVLRHSETGQEREIGLYEADPALENTTIELTVDSIGVDADPVAGYGVDAFIEGAFDDDVSPYLRVEFDDPENETLDFEFRVYERANESNVLFEGSADQLGEQAWTLPLSQDQATTTWIVEWNATRFDEEIGGSFVVGGGFIGPGLGIPDLYKHAIAVVLITVTSMFAGGKVGAEAGIITAPLVAGMFWLIGWMPDGYSLGIIMLALMLGGMILVARHGRR